jgi:hypothetical protein
MFTDASNFGWGAPVNEVDLTTKGTWSQEEAKMSISISELKAVQLGVETLSEPSKELESVYPLPSSMQNDMGTSPVLPWREHSPRPMTYTREAQHTGRRSLHEVDTTQWMLSKLFEICGLSDHRPFRNEN